MSEPEIQKYVLFEKKTGKIVSSGTSFHVDRLETSDLGVIAGQSVDNVQNAYVKHGAIMTMPDKPSEFHQWDYARSAWVFVTEAAWAVVRAKRNVLLQQTDWTQLPDVPFLTKQDWAEYRQALRDITNQQNPLNILWPLQPSN